MECVSDVDMKKRPWYTPARYQTSMKTAIHPDYFEDAKINCACGAVYQVGSTLKEISVELCAACHPFSTGKQKIIDAARRVEKFAEKSSKKATEKVTAKKAKEAARASKKKEKVPAAKKIS